MLYDADSPNPYRALLKYLSRVYDSPHLFSDEEEYGEENVGQGDE